MRTKLKREKLKFCRETLAKFFYDLARTTFSATVVGDVITMVINEQVTEAAIMLLITGIITTIVFARCAYQISKTTFK